MSTNVSTANQLATFFGGNMIGARLGLSLYPSRDKMYLAGFSTGLAALEGYNMSYYRTRKDARRKIFYSIIRLTLNTLCFMIDQDTENKQLMFKNFAWVSQLGGLLFGLAYGELYGKIESNDEQGIQV